MKIVYLGPFRFPIFDAAAARVSNMSKTLKDCGNDVLVLSWGGHYLEEDLISDGSYKHEGIEYIITEELDEKGSFLSRLKAKYKRGSKTLELLKSLDYVPDVIIMYNAKYFLTKQMIKFCKANNIKLVSDITEWYKFSDMHIDDIIPNFLNMHLLQKTVPNKIVISSYLSQYYSTSNNIVVPATCDPSEKKWSSSLELDYLYYSGITLIYAGNPAKKDMVHHVINAVNRLSNEGENIRFLILGITKENYLRNYKSYLLSDNLNNSIVFLGRVSQELIPSYYQVSDFMVLLRESNRKCNAGFPTKFAESVTSGTPVLANLTSDLGKYLHSGINGFVIEDCSYKSIYYTLKSKICSLNKEDIIELKNNMKRFAFHFDYRSYVEETSRFINNLKDIN